MKRFYRVLSGLIVAIFFVCSVAPAEKIVDGVKYTPSASVGDITVGLNFTATPSTHAFTTEGDLPDPITTTILLLDGDDDSDNDTLHLQDGTTTGQFLYLVATADVDADDTVTIDTTTDSTCTGCAAIVFDAVGETVSMRWTGSTWTVLQGGVGGAAGAPTSATYITQSADGTLTGEQALDDSNMEFVTLAESIDTVIAAATAGDALEIAAGDYTITADIDASKSIAITGQGPGITTIITTTDSINAFHVTASDVVIQNLTIDITASGTKGIYVDGTAGTVLSGVILRNVQIIMNSHAGVQDAIYFADASGEVWDTVITGTSSDDSAEGVVLVNAATAEAATTVKCYSVNVNVTAGGNNARGFYALDSSATSDCFLCLYNSTALATGATDHAAEAANGDAYLYAESCVFAGDNYDAINTGTAGAVRLRNCNLVNGLTSGTTTCSGTIVAGSITTAPIPDPMIIIKDSDATAGDNNYVLDVDATDTGDGTEDIDVTEQVQVAGTATTVRHIDADGDYETGTAAMPHKIVGQFVLNSMTETYTVSGDMTDPLTASTILLDGDNDGTAETLDLQDGGTVGQIALIIAHADIDAVGPDSATISFADTTCANCAATVFDVSGESTMLIWTGGTVGWAQLFLQDSL